MEQKTVLACRTCGVEFRRLGGLTAKDQLVAHVAILHFGGKKS